MKLSAELNHIVNEAITSKDWGSSGRSINRAAFYTGKLGPSMVEIDRQAIHHKPTFGSLDDKTAHILSKKFKGAGVYVIAQYPDPTEEGGAVLHRKFADTESKLWGALITLPETASDNKGIRQKYKATAVVAYDPEAKRPMSALDRMRARLNSK